MHTWIKQLFCDHFWKDVGEEYLREVRFREWASIYWTTYRFYAVTQKCVKCDKHNTIEVRRIVI